MKHTPFPGPIEVPSEITGQTNKALYMTDRLHAELLVRDCAQQCVLLSRTPYSRLVITETLLWWHRLGVIAFCSANQYDAFRHHLTRYDSLGSNTTSVPAVGKVPKLGRLIGPWRAPKKEDRPTKAELANRARLNGTDFPRATGRFYAPES